MRTTRMRPSLWLVLAFAIAATCWPIAASAVIRPSGQSMRVVDTPVNADVIHGRFVVWTSLDGGALTVAPAPSSTRPRISIASVAKEIWASPALLGRQEGPLGFGLVTITTRVAGVPRVSALPAWIGFARSTSIASCPSESVTATSTADGQAFPSNGFAAVVIGSAPGSPALSYTARSLVCDSAQPSSITNASEILSVPWKPVGPGPLTPGSLTVEALIPKCGGFEGISSGGSSKGMTVTIAASLPDRPKELCKAARWEMETVALNPPSGPGAPPPVASTSTPIRHGSVGPIRLAVPQAHR
jgi:hypothetical protein